MAIITLGCGNMAKAIVLGAHKALKYSKDTYCYTPSKTSAKELSAQIGGKHLLDLDDLKTLKSIDFVLIACKPQQVRDLAKSLIGKLNENTHIVSILAGVTIDTLQEIFKTKFVTRIMPSTPILVGKGISLVCHSDALEEQQKAFVESYFVTSSSVHLMKNESELDTVTTVSGCGPAYVFNFANAIAQALSAQGFDLKMSEQITRELFLGASSLMEASKDISLSKLQDQVTSKGGITIEAIKVFDKHDLTSISKEAIFAALKRTKELQKL